MERWEYGFDSCVFFSSFLVSNQHGRGIMVLDAMFYSEDDVSII